jgi:rubrerythrin
MEERLQKLFDIFQEAVESERQARQRYLDAAKLCQDDELKQLLLGLAEDELRHERELLVQFKEISTRLGKGVH